LTGDNTFAKKKPVSSRIRGIVVVVIVW